LKNHPRQLFLPRPTAALSFQSIGAGFNILGVPIARDAALVEAGGDLQLTAQAKIGVSYAGQLANSAHDQRWNALQKVRMGS
jgi:uncharacterized protein with beta-barrel porin domain